MSRSDDTSMGGYWNSPGTRIDSSQKPEYNLMKCQKNHKNQNMLMTWMRMHITSRGFVMQYVYTLFFPVLVVQIPNIKYVISTHIKIRIDWREKKVERIIVSAGLRKLSYKSRRLHSSEKILRNPTEWPFLCELGLEMSCLTAI